LAGEIDGKDWGIWKITDKGKRRLRREWTKWKPHYENIAEAGPQATKQGPPASDPNEALDLAIQTIDRSTQRELLRRLREIAPAAFERVVGDLMEKLGYANIKVTGGPHDEGVDGECTIDALGLYKVKFQAKRYAENHVVRAKLVRDFIGACDVARVQHGVLITTSSFTADAKNTANKSGRVQLIDGPTLSRRMISSGLAVRARRVLTHEPDVQYFEDL
jgi:restriction system protein